MEGWATWAKWAKRATREVGRGNLEGRDVMYKRCLMLKKWFLERWCRHRRRLVTFMGKPPAV